MNNLKTRFNYSPLESYLRNLVSSNILKTDDNKIFEITNNVTPHKIIEFKKDVICYSLAHEN